MTNKTSFLSCRLELEIKKKIKQKAEELGLDLTEFINKIAKEDIVFLDKNLKRLFSAMKLEVKNV
jgi:antitoxin component of RelBE/YafQ-DinJ toxin-antitoxin module